MARPRQAVTPAADALHEGTGLCDSALAACEVVHRARGDQFDIAFKRRRVPLIMRRLVRSGVTVYMLALAYPQDSRRARWNGMQMFVGVTNMDSLPLEASPHQAYMSYVHALPAYRWSGSDMVELGLALARGLGVHSVHLYDAASRSCGNGSTYDLSLIMLLSRRVTFYGRYGFRPLPSTLWDPPYQDTDDALGRLCKLLAGLSRVTVGSLAHYLAGVVRVLTPSAAELEKQKETREKTKAKDRVVFVAHETREAGIVDRVNYDLPLGNPALEEAGERVTHALASRLLAALAHVPAGTLLMPLLASGRLDCQTLSDFSRLVSKTRFPDLIRGRETIRWSAFPALGQVLAIRRLPMQAVVAADARQQRMASFCLT